MPSGEKMTTNKQITSTVTDQGKLEIAITESERPTPVSYTHLTLPTNREV